MLIRIYTDGACSDNPGPGGWSAIVYKENKCKVLSGHEVGTTNNRMELMAVVNALDYILGYDFKVDTDFEVYSDSAYVVNSINNDWVTKWRFNGWKTTRNDDIKNKDLWLKYIEYMSFIRKRGISVTVKKVKGHSGNTFNEYADEVAKRECDLAKKGCGQNA